jgi:hypothetical protein
MAEGYAISEADYRRIEAAIRKVERMADVNFRRRMPVSAWSPGGSGMRYPTECLSVFEPSFQLVKATHENRWIYFDNYTSGGIGADCNAILPSDLSPGDIYYMTCYHDLWANRYVHLYPNVGQSLILPTETVACVSTESSVIVSSGLNKYLRMGYFTHIGLTMYQLILVCCAANTWIPLRLTSCQVGPE